jgi:hypothetical protein
MSEITDLAKTIREENEKTRAQQERIASGEGPYAKETVEAAKASLKKQDEQRDTTKKLLGISERRMAKAEKLNDQIQAQEQIMAEQKAALEESGVDADKSAGYQKEQIKLDKLNAKKDNATGAAASEDAAKADAKDSKMMTYMKNTAGFLGGIAKQGMEKVKSGLSGFSKFAFGALAIAALSFLNSPQFDKYYDQIVNVIVPALTYIYENVIKPLAIFIGGKLKKLFGDIKEYIDGDKSLFSVLMENKLAIAGIVTALAPGLVFGALKLAVTGLVKGFVFLASKLSFGAIFAKIGAAFAVLKTFFVATLMPFLAAAAVPIAIIVGVVAGIVLAIYSLKKGFDDFMFELEATGSIWEATKTGIVSVISNILGLPFDLLKDGVSWIIGKIGSIFGLKSFTNAEKILDSFSFVDLLKEGLTFMGNAISGLFDFISDFVQNIIRKIPFKGDSIADALFGTKEEQEEKKKAKAEEQKQFELNRKALREKQKLEKEVEEAKKLEKIKAEKNALAPKAAANLDLKVPSAAASMGNTTVVDAKSINASTNSSNMTTGSTSIRNSNPFISAFANSSDFSFG